MSGMECVMEFLITVMEFIRRSSRGEVIPLDNWAAVLKPFFTLRFILRYVVLLLCGITLTYMVNHNFNSHSTEFTKQSIGEAQLIHFSIQKDNHISTLIRIDLYINNQNEHMVASFQPTSSLYIHDYLVAQEMGGEVTITPKNTRIIPTQIEAEFVQVPDVVSDYVEDNLKKYQNVPVRFNVSTKVVTNILAIGREHYTIEMECLLILVPAKGVVVDRKGTCTSSATDRYLRYFK